MDTAYELAWALRHDDNETVYFEQAVEYMRIAREAERRALHHAAEGDRFVAFDEANDARWGLCTAAVFFVAWLATVANREAFRRSMMLDCADTNGEQLSLDD